MIPLFDSTILRYQYAICREVQCVEKSAADRQIEWIKSLKRIEYWLGCKWDNCWRPKYDCMWLVLASLRHVWKYDWKYLYWETFARSNRIWLYEWRRWDYLFMLNLTGEINHIAIITKPFDWVWYRILDTLEKQTTATERFVRLYWKYYAGHYEVMVARYDKGPLIK